MLSPKKVKHRKQMKGKMRGKSLRGDKIQFGEFALQATSCGYISNRQIESARIAINRKAKRGGRVWIKIFPDKTLAKSLLKLGWVKERFSGNMGGCRTPW